MLEAVSIPILLKTVEFLFGEASKILQERQERRKAEQETKKGKALKEDTIVVDNSKTEEVIQSKEIALKQPVFQNVWFESEARVEHLFSILEIYTKNYYLAKEKYAKWGSALVPPIITHEITEAENGIFEVSKELKDILSKAYKKPVVILGIDSNEKSA